MPTHSQMAALEIHEAFHFVQESDPGAVGSGLYWLKVSTGTLKKRNSGNSAWVVIGGGAPTPFTALTDVPSSYSGQAGQLVAVKGAENGLEFIAPAAGGLNWVSVPATSADAGALNDAAYDATYFYLCVATNTWVRITLATFGLIFTYVSDGDLNDVLYWIGRSDGTTAWTNPHTATFITLIMSSTGGGSDTIEKLVDLMASPGVYTDGTLSNQWIAVDLGAGHSLAVNRYSLQHRGTFTAFALRNWKLQGSTSVATNDITGVNAATWVDIDVQVSNSTLAATASWVSPIISPASAPYRWLRILSTGVDSSGSSSYIILSEIKFYGEIIP